jgi:outer membrane protein assembly factor BamB
VGDSTGLVHLLSREDGTPLNRLTTDGSRHRGRRRCWWRHAGGGDRNGGVFGFAA